MITKASLTSCIHTTSPYVNLLAGFPDTPKDNLDHFVFYFVNRLLDNNKGSGFLAIQAETKLKALLPMSYEEIRDIAKTSPDYPDFVLIMEEKEAKVIANNQDMKAEMSLGNPL